MSEFFYDEFVYDRKEFYNKFDDDVNRIVVDILRPAGIKMSPRFIKAAWAGYCQTTAATSWEEPTQLNAWKVFRTCKYYMESKRYLKDFNWITPHEAIPENGSLVLVRFVATLRREDVPMLGTFQEKVQRVRLGMFDSVHIDDVRCWMYPKEVDLW